MDELRETIVGVIRERASRGPFDRDTVVREVMRLHPGANVVLMRQLVHDIAVNLDASTRRRMKI